MEGDHRQRDENSASENDQEIDRLDTGRVEHQQPDNPMKQDPEPILLTCSEWHADALHEDKATLIAFTEANDDERAILPMKADQAAAREAEGKDAEIWKQVPVDGPPELRLFTMGCIMGCLLDSLKKSEGTTPAVTDAMRHWDHVREVIMMTNAEKREACLATALYGFHDFLAATQARIPATAEWCRRLQHGLATFACEPSEPLSTRFYLFEMPKGRPMSFSRGCVKMSRGFH